MKKMDQHVTLNPRAGLYRVPDGHSESHIHHSFFVFGKENMKKSIFHLLTLISCIALTNTVVLSQTWKIVDGGQMKCYDVKGEISPPTAGQFFFGQDAQYSGNQRNYTVSGDGKTVCDNNTGLIWMRGPNITNTPPLRADKMNIDEARAWVATVNAANYGGFNDWRIPNIKEQYSLYDCRGTDPSNFTGTDNTVLTPFLDATAFNFAWGQTELGERIIDSQYGTDTKFILDPSGSGSTKLFGTNFADGRIKGYDLIDALSHTKKDFFWQLVRGTTNYGVNDFADNGDQTITDRATGQMWSKADNGSGMNWQEALAWVQAKNAENYLGHNDWRMPDIKELHSIVNYMNSPDYNGLPAIDTNYFTCSRITNENGQPDFGYYWSGSTHSPYSTTGSATEANYVAFGRALGWPTTVGKWIDVHGAGAQRSDPKEGPPFSHAIVHTVTVGSVTYTGYSWGPQGDAIRGSNYVRLVRNTGNGTGINDDPTVPSDLRLEQNYPNPFDAVTVIGYQLPLAAHVSLKIFNALGREIATLVSGEQQAGSHQASFSGRTFSLMSGLYFYRLTAGTFSQTKTMVVIH